MVHPSRLMRLRARASLPRASSRSPFSFAAQCGFSTSAEVVSPLSLEQYIQEVRPLLKPPVANRMIFNEQLQVMVVGGPNQRKVVHVGE